MGVLIPIALEWLNPLFSYGLNHPMGLPFVLPYGLGAIFASPAFSRAMDKTLRFLLFALALVAVLVVIYGIAKP